jgi:hypothetical protein
LGGAEGEIPLAYSPLVFAAFKEMATSVFCHL